IPASGSQRSSSARATCGWRRLPGTVLTSTRTATSAPLSSSASCSALAVPCPKVSNISTLSLCRPRSAGRRTSGWHEDRRAGRLLAVKAYEGFFTGTATVAGALVGLLFVAVSVAPDRLRGDNASIEHQAIASTALTALVDALFISLIGLQPNGGLDYGAVILGGLGLSSSIGLAARLWRARRSANLTRRWPYLLGFIIVVYAAQVISGLVTHSEGAEANLTVAFVY